MAEQNATIVDFNAPTESELFATLYYLVSGIDDESRVQRLTEKAQNMDAQERQLLVDCLSLSLDKDAAPLKTRAYVWRSLIKVASAANIFARRHTLDTAHLSPESDMASSGVYTIVGDDSRRVGVLKQVASRSNKSHAESLVSWVHLSHPNIQPLYAAFFQDQDHPSFLSPCTSSHDIRGYIAANSDVARLNLISDVVNGMSYIHQLNVVHGGLEPEKILVLNDGRAMITGLDSSGPPPTRYTAPELLADESAEPTRATDMWAFACLCYEMLSNNVPFFHIAREIQVAVAITRGTKPVRPGQESIGDVEIGDALWQIMLMCWELEPEGRPTCLSVQQMILALDNQARYPGTPLIALSFTKGTAMSLERMKSSLTGILNFGYPPSCRVPEYLRNQLLSFISNTTKLNETMAATKKLDSEDIQILVDFFDLLLEDLPAFGDQWPSKMLLSGIITSTHIIPHRYKPGHTVQYDPTPAFDGPYAKAYKGHELNIFVRTTATPWLVKYILAHSPSWFHSTHPNLIPFNGLFYEGPESPRLCVITPCWENGFLEDYASTLPQKHRLPLISDVIDGVAYLRDSLDLTFLYVNKESILVSNEGRAVLASFDLDLMFAKEIHSSTRRLRFSAPDFGNYCEDTIWSFGCLCYTILSRKEPYYQYTEDAQIQSAISRGELFRRPHCQSDIMDEIDDSAWSLIAKCCKLSRSDRITSTAIKKRIASWKIKDSRLPARNYQDTSLVATRPRPDVDFPYVEKLLGRIQIELLRNPLSILLQNHIKDVARAIQDLELNEIQILLDFLDWTLEEHLTAANEESRVLALLVKISSSTHILPRCYELQNIEYLPEPIAEGGYGTVHRGTDLNVCVKVMTQVDPKSLTYWIRELIVWAHTSHPNILPFCGVLPKNRAGHPSICLVSPFMRNGNLRHYAPRLPQKSRLPLALDIAKGLHYLHELGIIHGDLKGENVLISNEGRCLLTDFGAAQISIATVTTTVAPVPTTIRFAAPEVVLSIGKLTMERDIWSFGCIFYEMLSRLPPYYQYGHIVQVSAALARKELPQRPGTIKVYDNNGEDEWDDDDDDDDEEDWDEIDDQAWSLITKCCAPIPEDRLGTAAIQEHLMDMKIWDDRPAAKDVGGELSRLRLKSKIDMARVGELLDRLQYILVPSDQEQEGSFRILFNSLLGW